MPLSVTMAKKTKSQTDLHKIPKDLHKMIEASKELKNTWEGLTPLGRNEFICWIESAKKIETREQRIRRACEEVLSGKRRPCCWAGCPHR